mmetsp:Transcript_40466/g.69003  ORF Transcript_40466/g.69003 Transcript_40466/m.69003 type:complete len:94 (-) Transcript_40466:580-861(-)
MVDPVPDKDIEYPSASVIEPSVTDPYGSHPDENSLYLKARTDPPPCAPPLGDPIAITFPSCEILTVHPARSEFCPGITPFNDHDIAFALTKAP